jgi:hypothetical protein
MTHALDTVGPDCQSLGPNTLSLSHALERALRAKSDEHAQTPASTPGHKHQCTRATGVPQTLVRHAQPALRLRLAEDIPTPGMYSGRYTAIWTAML